MCDEFTFLSVAIGLPPLRMSTAQLDAKQKARLNELYRGHTISFADVLSRRVDRSVPIRPPHKALVDRITAVQLPPAVPKPPRPPWVSYVAQCRTFFKDAVFSFKSEDDISYGRFVFTRQNGPLMIAFEQCSPISLGRAEPEHCQPGPSFWAAEVSRWTRAFRVDPRQWAFTDSDDFSKGLDIWFLQQARRAEATIIVSDSEWECLADFIQHNALHESMADSSDDESVAELATETEDPAWVKLPWLFEDLMHIDVKGFALDRLISTYTLMS